jgi:phenylalanyl-tRNA synthetase beta chain
VRFPFSWLQELTNTQLSPQEVADRLTMQGLEVEGMNEFTPAFKGVVVGQVLDARQIEGSDHLKVCKVATGAEELQIVCGAPNVQNGQKVPVAVVGAELPGGLKIKPVKLRGVKSEGMICSEAELGLSDEASGIMVLNGNYSIGTSFEQVMQQRQETVIELSITPNRPDCLGMYGIARELCVSEGKSFDPPVPRVVEEPGSNEVYPIEIRDDEACPRYTGRIIRNVKVGESPGWLIERLNHAGIRSISNIVDITNYVMLTTGQPLHAFDLDKLRHGKIIVRNAANGESFTTLDEKTHQLSKDTLLICDGELPVALAGVMGGENSEVDFDTKNVLLESAYFSPTSIRKTAKTLDISTEASKRFEKGVDPNGCGLASDAATELICKYANGKATSVLIDAYPKQIDREKISFRPSRANLIIGESVSKDKANSILIHLGCEVDEKNDDWEVSVPTFRPDLTREIDLVEEVARVYGYNNVVPTTKNFVNLLSQTEPRIEFSDRLRNLAIRATLSEVVTLGMIAEKHARQFVGNEKALVRLLNPLSEEMAVLRPSLLSSMLPVVSYNINRKQADLRIFETGSTFTYENSNKKVVEKQKFAAIITGNKSSLSWENKTSAATFFDIKGIVQLILGHLGIEGVHFVPGQNHYFAYGASLEIEDKVIGHSGKMNAEILANFDIEKEVFACEVDLESLFDFSSKLGNKFKPYSVFPFVERDLAFVIDKNIPASSIIDSIERAGGELLTEVLLFDLYSGKQIPDDKKSLALSLKFQSMFRTLKDEEIDTAILQILANLEKKFEAKLRQ